MQLLTYKNNLPCANYGGGALYISGSVAQSVDQNTHAFNDTESGKYNMRLVCKLAIGDKWLNGKAWTTTEASFNVEIAPTGRGFTSIKDTKTLGMPYTGISGYIIPLPDVPLLGSVRFYMYTPIIDDSDDAVTAVYIKDFSLKFKSRDDSDIDKTYITSTNSTSSNSDRTYENVVDSDFVNEADDIELKISSYNADGACYSKIIMNDDYLRENLYSSIESALVRPEEALIRRIISRYSAPKIKLTQVLKRSDDISPYTVITDNYLSGKKFIVTGGEIDYKNNSFKCKMIEL